MSALAKKGVDLAHVAETLDGWQGREVFVRMVCESGCQAWIDEIHASDYSLYPEAEEDPDSGVFEPGWCMDVFWESGTMLSVWLKTTMVATVEGQIITLKFDEPELLDDERTYTIALLAHAEDA